MSGHTRPMSTGETMRKIKAEQPPQPRHSVSLIPAVYHVRVTTVCQ